MKQSNDQAEDIMLEELSGETRVVSFIAAIDQVKTKMDLVKLDSNDKSNKAAQEYYKQINVQYRQMLQLLYAAAAEAFPEDQVDPGHAMSSLGPDRILHDYNFRVLVSRKAKRIA